ncbi:unnamed protein product [Sympodiomycopsis kandeliae]
MGSTSVENDSGSSSILSILVSLLAYVGLGWYIFIWSLCLFGLYRSRWMFLHCAPVTQDSDTRRDEDLPGVSILRPLNGFDNGLFLNLCSTFEQDYPSDKYEILFSVKDANDEALHVVKEVMDQYPLRKCKVIISGDNEVGVNPKINNLLKSYSEAENDILWILDSQVQLQKSALRTSTRDLTAERVPSPSPQWLGRRSHGTKVGLVHHVPFGIDAKENHLGSQIERVFLSTTHAKMYLAINSLAIESCVMGKSNLWRKSDLEKVPDTFFNLAEGEDILGLQSFNTTSSHRALGRFSIYLAEDNMLALSLWKNPLSLAHTLSSSTACIARTNVADIKTVKDYISRRCRWIRVRRYMVPAATYIEPFTESILAGVVGYSALQYFISTSAYLFIPCHILSWFALDLGVYYALSQEQDQPLKSIFSSWQEMMKFFYHWSLRESLALPIWILAMCGGDTVIWRGRRFKILADGRASSASASSSSTSWFQSLRGRSTKGYTSLPTTSTTSHHRQS